MAEVFTGELYNHEREDRRKVGLPGDPGAEPMAKFKSPLAQQLLQIHQPNQRAYFCSEVGLEPNEQNVALVDAAYAELLELGYVETMWKHRVSVYSDGTPKHPFRITDAGLKAKA